VAPDTKRLKLKRIISQLSQDVETKGSNNTSAAESLDRLSAITPPLSRAGGLGLEFS
jgi:hypothetical protein